MINTDIQTSPGVFLPEPGAGHEAIAPLLDPALTAMFRQPVLTGAESAWHGHVPFAFWLVEAARPRSIVELGTHRGVSYLAFCQAVVDAGLAARCMAVDTWQGDAQAGFYDGAVLARLRAFHDPRYGHFSVLRRATFSAALDEVADGSVDLLHIDGFHSYDAVCTDFVSWLPKLSARGVVILHDTNEYQPGFGVWRFMRELRKSYPSFEFLHSHGLGVLTVGSDPPEAVAALCRLRDPDLIGRLRDRFGALGAIQERGSLIEAAAADRIARAEAAADLRAAQAEGAAEARVAEAEAAVTDRIAWMQAAARDASQSAIAARDAAVERAAAIEASLIWRLTGPVRRALNAAPRLRQAGRRAARLAWWIASGQLPHRLRERRAVPAGPVPVPAPVRLRRAPVPAPLPPPGDWPADPRLDPFVAESAIARAEAVLRLPARPPEAVPGEASAGISVVILTRNRAELIGPLLRDLVAARPALRDRGLGLQILVGDTGSDDPAVLALYRELDREIELVTGLRYHFSRNNNQVCFGHARHDHVLFLNNDVIFDDAAASLLAMRDAVVGTPDAAAAGHVLHFGDGSTLQHGGIGFLHDPALRGLPYHPQAHLAVPPEAFAAVAPVPAVTGACVMVTRRDFAALGGFEEAYAAECQDVDLCLKLRRIGREVLLVAGPRVLHLENATRPKGEENWGDRSLFLRRWFSFLAADGALDATGA